MIIQQYIFCFVYSDEYVAFYSSDEWKEVECEHLNSDRRYYEKRKALIDPEEKEVATKKKYYDPEPFQLRTEEKFTNGFDDLFDDLYFKAVTEN